MPRNRAIIPAIIARLLVTTGAYLWTSRRMKTLADYRSPLHLA